MAKDLFYQVCESLNLIELDYFGLEYYDKNMIQYWLDLERPIHRQLSLSMDNLNMNFAVKFYTTEPSKLEDELTRYFFFFLFPGIIDHLLSMIFFAHLDIYLHYK